MVHRLFGHYNRRTWSRSQDRFRGRFPLSTSAAPYRLESEYGRSIVSLLPDLNDAAWADIEQVGNALLDHLREQKPPAVIMDMSEIHFLGSAAVALVVRLWKATNEHGGLMVIVNQDPNVLEVLETAGLTRIWTIVESRDAAHRKFQQPAFSIASGAATPWIAAAGILALLGAAVGLFLLAQSSTENGQRAALAVQLGFAAVGLIAGTIGVLRDRGVRRAIGAVVVVACLLAGLLGILNMA